VGVPTPNNFAGGTYAGVVGGSDNEACDQQSVIGGGSYNGIGSSGTAIDSFIGAGYENGVTNENSFIGAGYLNAVSGQASFIGGGDYSYFFNGGYSSEVAGNQISGNDSFIGAGDQNVIAADESFVGSGGLNTIASGASYSSIIGGNRNTVSAEYASVIGGFGSAARGAYGTVAGGDANTAGGTLSFAAGYHADAAHNGSFVWSDYVSGSSAMKDAAANQFVVRASGGTYVYSNEGATSGVKLAAGSGAWASLSDRNAKTAIEPLDAASILAKVAALPVSTWRYQTEAGVRHIGPMAQDFYAAFKVGEDDRHITSIDEDGVALEAIKALAARNAQLERNDAEKDAQIAALAERVQKLEDASRIRW
jgi:Chaperone of endosialidase